MSLDPTARTRRNGRRARPAWMWAEFSAITQSPGGTTVVVVDGAVVDVVDGAVVDVVVAAPETLEAGVGLVGAPLRRRAHPASRPHEQPAAVAVAGQLPAGPGRGRPPEPAGVAHRNEVGGARQLGIGGGDAARSGEARPHDRRREDRVVLAREVDGGQARGAGRRPVALQREDRVDPRVPGGATAPPAPWECPLAPTCPRSRWPAKRLPLWPSNVVRLSRPASISLPLPALDELAAATTNPWEAKWRSSPS